MRPDSIETRDKGCYNSRTRQCDWECKSTKTKSSKCSALSSADIWSTKLAMELRDSIAKATGQTPHLIVNQLHRSKLDANRERKQATMGDYQSGTAFDTYQGFIKKAQELVKAN